MASIVTIQPLMAHSWRSAGIAVIALDFVSVLIGPTPRPPFSAHHAETIGQGEAAVARAKAAFPVLPSQETRAPWGSCATACVQDRKHSCKRRGLSRANTRPQVSWAGIP